MKVRPKILSFKPDERGVALVEFALIAPLLILFYVGMVELVQGLMAERKASHAASSIGDLVAQSSQVTGADVQNIFAIGSVILAPYPTGNEFQVRVSSVKLGEDKVARVTWSDSCQDDSSTALKECKVWEPRSETSVVALPAKILIEPGDTAVMAEVIYEYQSPFSELYVAFMNFGGKVVDGDGGFTFKSVFYLQPRQENEVIYKTT